MAYIINLGCWQSVFAVPSDLVDKHLRLANASHIKVLLYLLRHGGEQIESAALSAAVGISEGDVSDALRYWQTCGLLAQTEEFFTPADYVPSEETHAPTPAADTVTPAAQIQPETNTAPEEKNTAAPRPKRAERVRYNYSECVEYINSSDEIRQMLPVLEGILQKQLNHTEISVFVTLVHWYGLPPACVALLAEYCRSIGKGTIAYIESTGVGWAGDEINTVDLASQKITRLRNLRSAWNTVRTALDIPERKPTKTEENFCDKWINEFKFDTDLIKLAFDRCVDKTGKLSMKYMNGIIENWYKQGISTLEQAENEERPPQNNNTANSSPSGRYEPTYDKKDIETVMYDEWFGDADDNEN